tara:strand:- start:796 stop:1179 length:384 start_codon:yes stop_codon:yes gene_type:complete
MYILIVSLLLLGLSFYLFDLDTNITLVSCVIIILLLTSLFNKNHYERFSILNLQDLYLSSMAELERIFNEKLDIIGENNYPKINITSSKFNEDLSKKECKCPKLNINKNQLSNKEFIKLIEQIKSKE